MVGDSRNPNNLPKLSDAKSAIYESMKHLWELRENKLHNFQKKQISEHQASLEQSEIRRKSFEQFFENNQGVYSLLKTQLLDETENTTGSENTLQESSLTGHFLRCFSDTSGDSSSMNQSQDGQLKSCYQSVEQRLQNSLGKENPIEEENSDKLTPGNASSIKPKKAFLKKGSGLLRFMPKQKRNASNFSHSSESQISLPDVPTKSISKSNLRNLHPTQHTNRVQFSEPIAFVHEEKTIEPSLEQGSEYIFENLRSDDDECKSSYYTSSNSKVADSNLPSDISLNSENQELAEFEMLENCAQNSSFNSDSSIVQRVLHGEPIRETLTKQKSTLQTCEKVQQIQKVPSVMAGLNNRIQINSLEDMEKRKQRLNGLISDINPRITSLRNFTSNTNPLESIAEVSDRCSTPIECRSSSPSLHDNSSKDTSLESVIFVPPSQASVSGNTELNDHLIYKQFNGEPKNTESELNSEFESNSSPKQILRSKMQELENEITIYQETNARLSVICKEREEVLKKLKKEKDEISKYKDEEKKKFDLELDNERKQLKRERETFNRLQKLRRDNPGKKEREEMAALRQEVEKLQEDIKRQKNKFNTDMRRLKNQLVSAEKERDNLKLENITLEEQCQDLLTAVRNTRKEESKKKKLENQANFDLEKEKECVCFKKIETEDKSTFVDEELLSPIQSIKTGGFSTKAKVRFDLNPKNASSRSPSILEDISHHYEDEVSRENTQNDLEINKMKDHDDQSNEEVLLEEIKEGDKVERIYISGEKEVIYRSGSIRRISTDGKTKISYPNGDVMEILPDKSEVLQYVTGVVSTHLPSGLKITKFPDGQIHQLHPDGLEEVTFPNGTTECFFPNGTKEIHDKDGTVTRLFVDGTKITEFTNGEKIICTSTSKRREWPDGSVKIIYNCGRQETRFPDGRIRIKDKDGKSIVDTKYYKRLGG